MQNTDYYVEVVVRAVVSVSAESPGEALIRARDSLLAPDASSVCPVLEVQTGSLETPLSVQ